jgi:hypothetical protein
VTFDPVAPAAIASLLGSWRRVGRLPVAGRLCLAGLAGRSELQCSAPPDMTALRMRRRLGAGGDPADATPEIAAQMSLAQDPWPAAAVVDTSSDADETLDKALALLERGVARDFATSGSGRFGPGSRRVCCGVMSS